MKQLRHLILTPLYPPTRFGGIEKIVQHIAEGFIKIGDMVDVFTLTTNDSLAAQNDIIEGVMVHRTVYESSGTSHMSAMLSKQNELIKIIIKSCNNDQIPTIIHAHDWFVSPAALKLRKLLNYPLLAVFHSDKRSEYRNNLDHSRLRIHQLQRKLAHNADVVFCYSKFMRNCITESMSLPQDRINLFQCGIDEDCLRRSPDPKLTPAYRLLYLGRLAPEKNVETLIQAFRKVIKYYPLSTLRIVGDGSERIKLQNMVTELGIAAFVNFVPFTSSKELIDREFLDADLLVLPSIFEPFGLVVLEAISRYLPVIVAATGGPAEIVRDGVTGLCFTPGNAQDLAQRILICLGNPEHAHQMAHAAFEEARNRFRWSSAVSTIRDACISLITNQKY